MNEIKVKNKKILIIHQIKDFHTEIKKSEKNKTRRDYITQKDIERTHIYRKKSDSLEYLNLFNEFVQFYGLTKKNLEDAEFDEEEKDFLNFVVTNRMKKILNYRYLIEFNNKFKLVFFPECPVGLIYKSFIIFSADLNELENEMIQYVNFINSEDYFQSLELDDLMFTFFRISPNFRIVNDLVEFFNKLMIKKLERITLKFKREPPENSPNIMIGTQNSYFSSRGKYLNLDFIISIKNFYLNLSQR